MSEHRIRVLFVCTGNSARSQMAEALLARDGGEAFETFSAGTEPRGVNPLTIQALANIGIDWSNARSKSLVQYLDQPFEFVITVCDRAREACPVFPGGRTRLHWDFDDPAEAVGTDAERLVVFERIRDEIALRISAFVDEVNSSFTAGMTTQ